VEVIVSATIAESRSPQVMDELRTSLVHLHGIPEGDLPATDAGLFQAWVEVVVGNAAINEHEMLGGLAECEWKYHHQHPCCTECGGIRPGPCCSVDECACDAVASESGTT